MPIYIILCWWITGCALFFIIATCVRIRLLQRDWPSSPWSAKKEARYKEIERQDKLFGKILNTSLVLINIVALIIWLTL